MAPQDIAAEILKRHPEWRKELNARQLRMLKRAIAEAVLLSAHELMSPEETDKAIRKRVRDAGKPSAALRAYRNRLDWTQKQLAERSGIPQPHIAAMESGKRNIGVIAAKKLGLALGVAYQKLI